MATKLEKEYLGRVAALGCICCTNNGFEDSPAEIHHLRDGHGVADRAPYWETLPLCPIHHRTGTGNAKSGGEIGFHAAQLHYIKEYDRNGVPVEPDENEWLSRWEQRYGTERDLLTQIHGQLADELMDRVAVDKAEYYSRVQKQERVA